MSEVLQANVFFIITSISVIILTVLLSIVLIKVIRILGILREISKRFKKGSEALSDDIKTVRSFIVDDLIGGILRAFAGSSEKRTKRRIKKESKKKAKKEEETNEK